METSQSNVPCEPCDVVSVPARQGLEAVDILRRAPGDGVGPVLHIEGGGTLVFVVPAGTAAGWDVPGSTCTETDGRGLRLEGTDAQGPHEEEPALMGQDVALPAPPAEGCDWLLPPGEADLATDPAVLRRALGEAARLIEAADSCR
ncbi:hypothetical protein [Streptomyces galbus]|uniref:hypothetical protein n=1 Tax=Streptomyces galbus TaxID=33898 RepID=UPI0015838410|nr:hypothetical protein [Streptomyces galbus]GHD46069.1 hypothetical protein GCM10010335_52320 [Streptomyces galbus]